ncbi:MAG: phosphoribosylglycinamide formyltransferase [Gemmatimonadaceae bacterium]|nr:phosphoribosylglycinamide formyltransferase [Gemmatimonadaceae bacterium]
MRARIAVLASGRGSNLEAILDFLDSAPGASYEVVIVISNKADTGALDIARTRKIPASFIDVSIDSDGSLLLALLRSYGAEIVALAGYLKKIPETVVSAFNGRIVNIHPALLPLHGGEGMYGARVHAAVLSAGERESGATVHLVDAEYDRGPVVAQWRVPVLPGDDAHSLAERVLKVEHKLYPRALEIVAALHLASSER